MTPEIVLSEFAAPAILLMHGTDGEAVRYDGDFQHGSVVEFTLQFASPRIEELELITDQGKQYAERFFASQKLKFILLLGSSNSNWSLGGTAAIAEWVTIAEELSHYAIFSYAFNEIRSISEAFQIPFCLVQVLSTIYFALCSVAPQQMHIFLLSLPTTS